MKQKKFEPAAVDFSPDEPQTITVLPRVAVSQIFRVLNDPYWRTQPLCEQAYRIAKDIGIKTKYA